MKISPEELAAFADGQLGPRRHKEIASAVEADASLAAKVRSHRALRARLASHFAPILSAHPPQVLAGHSAQDREDAADSAPIKEMRQARHIPIWPWLVASGLVALLLLALLVPERESGEVPADDLAQGELAEALDEQLVTEQAADEPIRMLVSFRDAEGQYCRVFRGAEQGGIACRDDEGWRSADGDEVLPAGADASELLARAQEMAASPALGPAEEEAARDQGWR